MVVPTMGGWGRPALEEHPTPGNPRRFIVNTSGANLTLVVPNTADSKHSSTTTIVFPHGATVLAPPPPPPPHHRTYSTPTVVAAPLFKNGAKKRDLNSTS